MRLKYNLEMRQRECLFSRLCNATKNGSCFPTSRRIYNPRQHFRKTFFSSPHPPRLAPTPRNHLQLSRRIRYLHRFTRHHIHFSRPRIRFACRPHIRCYRYPPPPPPLHPLSPLLLCRIELILCPSIDTRILSPRNDFCYWDFSSRH